MLRSSFPLIFSALTICLPVVHAQEAKPLPRDDKNIYGSFENGLRYIIRKHDKPAERIAVYLHICSGALNENEKQNGIAHFIEHMAFNGSTHFPPGKLVPALNEMGMKFGAHSNAHTSLHETVFKLFMPDNSDAKRDLALTVLGDVAHGLLMLPEEIENERAVILQEKRAGKGVDQRIREQVTKLLYPECRMVVHDVIGTEEAIQGFPQAEFKAYWDTWYRPENMTLIVVGDMDTNAMIKAAQKHLGEFTARAEARPAMTTGVKAVNEPRAFVISDKEQSMGKVQMISIQEGRPPMSTEADYRQSMLGQLGSGMLNRRLQNMVQNGEAKFLGAGVGTDRLFSDAFQATGGAMAQAENWQPVLEQMIGEVQRVIAHGFTQQELDLVSKGLLSQAERMVETEATWEAKSLINGMSQSVGMQGPLLSAAQNLELSQNILGAVKLTDVEESFRQDFANQAYSYVLIMPKKDGLDLPETAEVLQVAEAAWKSKTEAVEEKAVADAILKTLPEPGKIASKTTDEALGITTVEFANGAVLHHRFMDVEENSVSWNISFPGGLIQETADNKGVSSIVSLAQATSDLSSTQIRDLMVGKNVRTSTRMGQDHFTFQVSGDPEDLEQGLQLTHALILDGVVESSALDNWKTRTLEQLEAGKHQPQTQLRNAISSIFYPGDSRFTEMTPAQVEKLDTKQAESWLRQVFQTGPMEIAVVGDMSLEDCLPLAQRYLASLPKPTGDVQALAALRQANFAKGPHRKELTVDSITPMGMVLAGYKGCDYDDHLDRRGLVLIANIISDRLRIQVREEQGLVYSIGCQNEVSQSMKGGGMIYAAAPTKPEMVGELAAAILSIMQEFAQKGPSAEELQVAKEQVRVSLEKSYKEPGFWLGMLSQRRFHQIEISEMAKVQEIYAAFTPEKLREVAAKYFVEDRLVQVTVAPESAGSPADSPADNKAE